MSVTTSKTRGLGIAWGSEAHNPSADGVQLLATLLSEAQPVTLTGERLLVAQAMQLLMQLDRALLEARIHWNQDRFRRLMHIRPKSVLRVRRRWAKLDPTPVVPLGGLRRRYHANLAGYLYDSKH